VPVGYDWTAPSALPQFLPWLAILALLLLRPNRCASAWWILVPLAGAAAVGMVPQSAVAFMPSSQAEVFMAFISALGFGLAAVWLVSSYLGWKHRILALLGILLGLGVVSLFAFLVTQDVGREMFEVGIFLAASAAVISVALTLAGMVCRGRYAWLRLSLWVLAALAVLWLLLIGPFFLVAMISGRGQVPLGALFGVVGITTGITFGVMLPFLVLSFVNELYRERLKGLLHLGGTEGPPVITSPIPAVPEAAGG
jgi:hypothetical protein